MVWIRKCLQRGREKTRNLYLDKLKRISGSLYCTCSLADWPFCLIIILDRSSNGCSRQNQEGKVEGSFGALTRKAKTCIHLIAKK